MLSRVARTRGLEILEVEIAARAAGRANEQDIAAMSEAVRTMDANIHDADAFIEADNRFHAALAQATHNPLIFALLNSIVNLLSEQLRTAGSCRHS